MFNSPEWAARIDIDTARGIAAAISTPRLAPYGLRNAQGVDPVGAVARHCRNVVLCEAAYPVLHLLEVVMRNRVHDAFRAHYRADDWYSQGWIMQGHCNLVVEAQANLRKQGKLPESDRIVAALGFGFWCAMFSHHYEHGAGPWPALIRSVLPRVPKSWATRARIRSRVEEARELRNRVFHHEPILHFPDLLERHRRLLELLGWFSPETRHHLENVCRFRATYQDRLTTIEPP